jgi:hypothetical protein
LGLPGRETIAITSREYRQRAADCLQLANEASDVYVKVALTELAAEFRQMAESDQMAEAEQGEQ